MTETSAGRICWFSVTAAICVTTRRRTRRAGTYITGGVTSRQVDPAGAVIGEHPTHLAEHVDHRLHEQVGGGFQPDLVVDAASTATRANITGCDGRVALRPSCGRIREVAPGGIVGLVILLPCAPVPAFYMPVVTMPASSRPLIHRTAAADATVGELSALRLVVAVGVAAVPLTRPVIPESPVRRRGDHAVNRPGLELGEHVTDVADPEREVGVLQVRPHSASSASCATHSPRAAAGSPQ
jgi:hypothetical protein